MQEAASKPNVTILQSNGFEGHYALHWRGVDWSSAPLLYPAGLGGRPSLLRALEGGGEGKARNCSRSLVCMEGTQEKAFRLKKAWLTRC